MSVNYYVSTFLDANGKLIKMDNSLSEQGSQLFICQSFFATLGTDGDGSIYRIFANVPANYVPLWGTIANDAMAGFTSASLGLYLPNLGAVKSANCFMSAISMAAATTSTSPKTAIDALQSMTIANTTKKLFQLAGDTLSISGGTPPAYDIGLLATTRGSVAGNVAVTMVFARG